MDWAIDVAGRKALLDANVLFSAPIRDLMLQLSLSGLFQARWTDQIHREWIEALIAKEPHRDRQKLERTRKLMNEAVRGCLIGRYGHLVEKLALPDPDDRHVLAAALAGHCDCIVTMNLKDFPAAALARHGLAAFHPDEFLTDLLKSAPVAFCAGVAKVRERLDNPPYGRQAYADVLRRAGLPATASELIAAKHPF